MEWSRPGFYDTIFAVQSLQNLSKLVIFSFGMCFGCHKVDLVEVNGLAGNIIKMHDVKYYNHYDLLSQILDKVKVERPDLKGRAKVLVGRKHLEDIDITGDQGQLSMTLILNPNQLEFKNISKSAKNLCAKDGIIYPGFLIRTNQTLDPTHMYTMQEVLNMKADILLTGPRVGESSDYVVKNPDANDSTLRPHIVQFSEQSICLYLAQYNLSDKIVAEQKVLKEKYATIKSVCIEEYREQVPHALVKLTESKIHNLYSEDNSVIAEILTQLESTELNSEEFVVEPYQPRANIFCIQGNDNRTYLKSRIVGEAGKYTLDDVINKFMIISYEANFTYVVDDRRMGKQTSFNELSPEQSRVFLKLLKVVESIIPEEKSEEEINLEKSIKASQETRSKIRPCFDWALRDLGWLPEDPGWERCERIIAEIKVGAQSYLL